MSIARIVISDRVNAWLHTYAGMFRETSGIYDAEGIVSWALADLELPDSYIPLIAHLALQYIQKERQRVSHTHHTA